MWQDLIPLQNVVHLQYCKIKDHCNKFVHNFDCSLFICRTSKKTPSLNWFPKQQPESRVLAKVWPCLTRLLHSSAISNFVWQITKKDGNLRGGEGAGILKYDLPYYSMPFLLHLSAIIQCPFYFIYLLLFNVLSTLSICYYSMPFLPYLSAIIQCSLYFIYLLLFNALSTLSICYYSMPILLYLSAIIQCPF